MAAVVDLVPLLLWSIAFALLYLLAQMATKIQGVFSGLPWPLSHIGDPVASVLRLIAGELTSATKYAEGQMVRWFNGLTGWVLLVIAMPILLAEGIYKALQYLWNTAIDVAIDIAVKPVRAIASAAQAKVDTLQRTVANDFSAGKAYAAAQADAALADAKSWARAEINAARNTAEDYADEAVRKLRTTEDTAIAGAVAIATAAKAAGIKAAGEAESAAESVAAKALAQSEAAAEIALGHVKAIAITAETDLTDLQHYIKGLDLEKLLAGSTAIATLVAIVLAETGLENSSCRGKVKQICGTNPSQWSNLLLGIAAAGVGFSLADIAEAAAHLVRDASGLLDEAAAGVLAEAPAIGRVIGDVANGIAQAA